MYMAGIIETIVTCTTGIIAIILGWLLWKKQKIQFIHDYHHKNVMQQDIQPYTKLWGIALLILGVCVFPVGIINCIFHTELGWILFVVGMAICFIIGNKAQKTYNHTWFS